MSERLHAPMTHFFGATDIGKARRSNQDHYLIADMRRLLKVCDSSVERLDQQSVVSSHPGELLIIADGMGGHPNGEYASQTAIAFMTDYVANLMPRFLNIDPNDDHEFCRSLREGPILVHRQFQKEGEIDPMKAEMGTTLTTAYIVWPYLYIVHVGDTRCYLFRNGELSQLTKDHTVAQYLADISEPPTTPSQSSSLQNMLWNSVTAAKTPPEPQICREKLQTGDSVLLCSDGLTKHMTTDEIITVLASSESVEMKTNQLIDEANRRGGRDNISIVIGAFDGPPDAELHCNPRQFKVIDSLSDTDVEFTVFP